MLARPPNLCPALLRGRCGNSGFKPSAVSGQRTIPTLPLPGRKPSPTFAGVMRPSKVSRARPLRLCRNWRRNFRCRSANQGVSANHSMRRFTSGHRLIPRRQSNGCVNSRKGRFACWLQRWRCRVGFSGTLRMPLRRSRSCLKGRLVSVWRSRRPDVGQRQVRVQRQSGRSAP